MGSWWWYLARSSGFIAWLTSAASIGFGLAMAARWRGRTGPGWMLAMHRWMAALTLGLIGVHLVALFADSYVAFSPADLLVPFASGYRTTAVALGVLSMWGLVAVEATSLLRRRMTRRAWKAVHLTSYGAFVASTVHGVSAGTDAHQRWFAVLTGVVAGAVAAGTALRAMQHRPAKPPRPNARPAAA